VLFFNNTLFQACGIGWSQVHHSMYRIIHNVMSRQASSDSCRYLGGYLAIVSDAQETVAIQEFIATLGYVNTFMYIDGSDAAQEGLWRTEAGDVMTYTGMSDGQPDGNRTENCLYMLAMNVGDCNCTRDQHFVSAVCEMWCFFVRRTCHSGVLLSIHKQRVGKYVKTNLIGVFLLCVIEII